MSLVAVSISVRTRCKRRTRPSRRVRIGTWQYPFLLPQEPRRAAYPGIPSVVIDQYKEAPELLSGASAYLERIPDTFLLEALARPSRPVARAIPAHHRLRPPAPLAPSHTIRFCPARCSDRRRCAGTVGEQIELDTGLLGTAEQHIADAAEAHAPLGGEEQPGRVAGFGMARTQPQIRVERSRRLRPERRHPIAAPLAQHAHLLLIQIEIIQTNADQLRPAHARIEQQAHDGRVAALLKALPLADLQQRPDGLLRQHAPRLRLVGWPAHACHRMLGDLLTQQPREEPVQLGIARDDRAGLEMIEQPADIGLHVFAADVLRRRGQLAPDEEAGELMDGMRVGVDGARRLVLRMERTAKRQHALVPGGGHLRRNRDGRVNRSYHVLPLSENVSIAVFQCCATERVTERALRSRKLWGVACA